MNKAQSVWIAVIVAIAALALIAIVFIANKETVDDMQTSPVELPAGETATGTATTTEEVFAPEASYVNLTIAEAETLAASNGVPFRIVEQDGEPLAATMDYRPGRINAKVQNGLVVEVTVE